MMKERVSGLDVVALVSNSDAHSPSKLGREANVLDCQRSYAGITAALQSRDVRRFPYTLEFFPEEGKYHYDGHRACGVCLAPGQSRQRGLRCPVCGKPLTLGVLHRVEALADRPQGGAPPPGATGQKRIVPLEELLAEAFGCGVNTRRVREEYLRLVVAGGSEFGVLLDRSLEELARFCRPEVLKVLRRMREGRISVAPGYDGVFGKVSLT
jgi:PHP family Zn ribbon phosphoesterase